MKIAKQNLLALLLASICVSHTLDMACAEQSEKPVARDNTAVNIRDTRANLRTPEQQSSEKPALDRTKAVREALFARKELSTYAQNVKIITDDQGVVTLRGPVRSESERKEITDVAKEIVGADHVVDLLEIAPNR